MLLLQPGDVAAKWAWLVKQGVALLRETIHRAEATLKKAGNNVCTFGCKRGRSTDTLFVASLSSL